MTPDIFTKDAFTEWASQKPARRRYAYWSNDCAFGQYLAEHGVQYASIGRKIWAATEGIVIPLPAGIEAALRERPHTFGALVDRLTQTAA